MNKLIYLTILTLSFGTLSAQTTYPSLKFRKPTTSDNITWKFKSVAPSVDALITVVRTKNASLDKIDDSTTYPLAWNPFIKYTNTPASASDSSYVEFKVAFVNANGSAHNMSSVAMAIVDCDGGLNGLNIFREMVKTTLPATPKGIIGTLISSITGAGWLTNISGPNQYSSMDTNNFLAMSQINYSNISSYTLKVGVIGKIAGGTTRQASFYFKNFAPLTLVLPVKLMNFNAKAKNNNNLVEWTTTSEENSDRFELYRSFDGKNFTLAGTVKAAGNSQMMNTYNFVDQKFAGETQEHVYYKLRMIDYNGQYTWSSIAHINNLVDINTTVVSSVYPNPTKGELNVSFKSVADTEFTMEVVDMFGKTLLTSSSTDLNNNSNITLDVNEFPNGIYFIKVKGLDGNASFTRFIKN